MINHDKLTISPIDHGYVFAMAFRLKCHEVSVEFRDLPAMLTPEGSPLSTQVLMLWTHIHYIFGEMSWPNDKFMDVYGGKIGMDRTKWLKYTKMTKGPPQKKLMNIQNACTVRSVAYSRRPGEKFGRRKGTAVNFEQLIECIHFFVTGLLRDLHWIYRVWVVFHGMFCSHLFLPIFQSLRAVASTFESWRCLWALGPCFANIKRGHHGRPGHMTPRRWDGRERYTKAIS